MAAFSLAREQIHDASSSAAILDRISTGWQIEVLWQRDPNDDLFLLLLTGDVARPSAGQKRLREHTASLRRSSGTLHCR
jgi:hypothetical protein